MIENIKILMNSLIKILKVHCQSSTSEELNKFSIESDIVLAEIC